MSYRSHEITAFSSSGTSLIINAPAGLVDGDVVTLVVLYENTTSTTITWPAGFTEIHNASVDLSTISASRGKVLLAAQKVAASEPASYTITNTHSLKQGYSFAHSGRNGAASVPIFTGVDADNTTTFSTALTGYTASANDDIIIIGGSASDVDRDVTGYTAPSGYTQRDEAVGPANAWLHFTAFTKDGQSAGATGTISFDTTISTGNTDSFGLVIPLAASAPSRSITNIDGDNDVQPGQSARIKITSGLDTDNTITATLGGESLIVQDQGEIYAKQSLEPNAGLDGALNSYYPNGSRAWAYTTIAAKSTLTVSGTGDLAYIFPKVVVAKNHDILMCSTTGSSHVATDNKVIVMRSTDFGRTFSAPVDVFKDPEANTATRTLTAFREPVTDDIIIMAAVGDLPITQTAPYHRIWLIRSSDNGVTWTTTDITNQMPAAGSGVEIFHSKPVQTSNGLALLTYWFGTIHIIFSTDNGYTWGNAVSIPNDVPLSQGTEPGIIAVTPDNLVVSPRNNDEAGNKSYIKSTDGGLTWQAQSSYQSMNLGSPIQDQPISFLLTGTEILAVFPARNPVYELWVGRLDKDAFWANPHDMWSASNLTWQSMYSAQAIQTIDFGNAYLEPFIDEENIGRALISWDDKDAVGSNIVPMIATFPE